MFGIMMKADLDKASEDIHARISRMQTDMDARRAGMNNTRETVQWLEDRMRTLAETSRVMGGQIVRLKSRVSTLERNTVPIQVLHIHELMLAAAVELACSKATPAESAMLLDILSRYRQQIVDIGKPAAHAIPAPTLTAEEIAAFMEATAAQPKDPEEPTPPTEEHPTNESL